MTRGKAKAQEPQQGDPGKVLNSQNWRGCEDVARKVCERMRAARILNGLTLEEASERIGYHGNKTQLSLIETGERFPPLWVFFKAADTYVVPLDYLTGRIDEAEASLFDCERAAVTRFIGTQLQGHLSAIGLMVAKTRAEGAPAVQMARGLVEHLADWLGAYERMKYRNPDWEETPAGAPVEAAAVKLAVALREAKQAIERYDNFGRVALELEQRRHAQATVLPLFPDLPMPRPRPGSDVSLDVIGGTGARINFEVLRRKA